MSAFSSHDSDSLVLSDVRDLLYIIAKRLCARDTLDEDKARQALVRFYKERGEALEGTE